MRQGINGYELSASDLANHLGCHHLTQLDLAVLAGTQSPPQWRDPALAALQDRGLELERAYLGHLLAQGLRVAEPGSEADLSSLDRTLAAMREGVDVIYQAALQSGPWQGRVDFLCKVNEPSDLGAWSYEALDTKLARETRAGTVLQLCLYSHMLGELQGLLPEHMHVIIPRETFGRTTFRVSDFLAYHRLVQRQLERAIAPGFETAAIYPDPVPLCDACRWWPTCDRKRREDDHLCLVAGASKLQINELRGWGVNTLTGLAELPLPLERRLQRAAVETYHRIREQARIQLERQRTGLARYELLAPVEGQGLYRLPEPSTGDVFLDIESDPFVGIGGLEYLFGWTTASTGQATSFSRWALDPAAEKAAFEEFIDFVMARWTQYPNLHVYHFAAYEPGALKRLMGRYATREEELDRLLRGKRFIDLHAVTRQALRASVERYSLKELEVFYGFERTIPLPEAALALRAVNLQLELGRRETIPAETVAAVSAYNLDDCLSTMRLRDWLEERREELARSGHPVARPPLEAGAPSEAVDEHQQRIQALYERLAGDVSPDPAERGESGQARWLLANMLDWHRREKKAAWWEYFRLCALPPEELLEEKAGLAGLEFVGRVGTVAKSVIDRYRFPPQECEIRARDDLRDSDGAAFGKADAVDSTAGTLDIRKGPSIAARHPSAVFKHASVSDDVQRDAILRLGQWVAENGIDADGPYRAARDLLLRRTPRPGFELVEGEGPLAAARAWVTALDRSVLPIQGPPGAGKTHTGANMITALVRANRKVGIVALSHKVIRNLLEKVVEIAESERTPVRCLQKVSERSEAPHPAIKETTDNRAVAEALRSGRVDVVAGTGWLWAREELRQSVDVLFVDEAGQLALADVLAVSQAAHNLVLLGDPQQLRQPQQGSHPDGTDVSALEHLLGEHKTIPPERGLFLDQTWRMHPAVCAFISEQFYEGRLHPRPDLDRQVLDGSTPLAGAGLWFVPVEHDGNQSSSPEEVERIASLLQELTSTGVHWTDHRGVRRPLVPGDILVIAPYNAQVAALAERLPSARIGTVDKFQGQEAPVVIFSLTTSTPEDAPRGMDFLYSLNRLNVAVSRARTASILVGSPRLFEPECRSPAQMRLANGFCRYLELATRA